MFWKRESKSDRCEQTVMLHPDGDGTEIECLDKYGSFSLLVDDVEAATGTHAAFYVTANQYNTSIFRCASVTGKEGEQVTLGWKTGEKPRLKFVQGPLDRKERRYVVKWSR